MEIFWNLVISMENKLSVFVGIVSDEKVETPVIVKHLLQIEGANEAYELTGSYDILLKINSDSVQNLNKAVESVRATNGVKSTNTYLILGEKR